MAPVLNINFKCVMPIFENEMASSLPGNVKHIIHKLGNTILSSVYNTAEGSFKKGYLVDNAKCNWKNIEQSFNESPNDFSTLHQECRNGLDNPINNIFTDAENSPHILLQQAITPHQNSTANIFDQLYKVTDDYMFSQGDITEINGADFLGLNECTKEGAISALQNYNAYKETLIPHASFINTLENTLNRLGISLDNISPAEIGKHILDQLDKAYTEATTASSVNTLENTLNRLGISLDNISPAEIGKNILNLLDKPFTEATVSTTEKPNDGTNGGEVWGYLAVAGGTLALGAILGYAAKYGWDWYKGKNIEDEDLDLVTDNKNSKYIELLHKNFKGNSVILDKIVEIHDLNDVIKIARSNEQYKFSILSLTNLNNEIIKLNSPSSIVMNLDSSSRILHEICQGLDGSDSLNTISNFATLITTIRTADTESEEYKKSIAKIFEIFNPHYTNIEYQDPEVPLLADGSPSSDSSGLSVE
ncbi:DUF5460 family protein [Rickettsia endosymbiont of Cantharis rufa]|uniref:DUF5460 family protein n=1 Tax=Rickettsia endosymbiont of Cantharis rufa TaxID=3066248 RepID=UPI003132F177